MMYNVTEISDHRVNDNADGANSACPQGVA